MPYRLIDSYHCYIPEELNLNQMGMRLSVLTVYILVVLIGYSFTKSDDGYARNETIVGEDLYNALLQFFQLFPELQKNEFYVTGESYAGN